jgi:2-keto-4-pentenoate hydratase/2-oxohepta-3-ene-1,7-dioic acid hydratase in catechol pathway
MRIVGIRRDGGPVEVAALAEDSASVTVVAGLEQFWADAADFLAHEPDGETVDAADVEFVPPVLPGARVICIGLNYLKHVAEGAYAAEGVPPSPTLFALGTAVRLGELLRTGRRGLVLGACSTVLVGAVALGALALTG